VSAPDKIKPQGFAPNPTNFLKKVRQKHKKNRALRGFFDEVLMKLFQKFPGLGGAQGFNFN